MNHMKCPKCGHCMVEQRNMPYLNDNTYFFKCNHCNYISELFTDNNKPFGKNYSDCPDCEKGLKDWENEKKWVAIRRLKEEHKKIIDKMQKEFGKMTDDDWNNLLIDFYLMNKKTKRGNTKKKKTPTKKKIRKKKKEEDV